MVTIKDMADMAGVAPTTVSNVLHGRTKKMSRETLERVERIIKECNYVTNMGARLLANYGSRIIGVIMMYGRREEKDAVQNPFFAEMMGGLERMIRENGYYMMLYTSGNVEESLQIAASWNIEGLIILGSQPEDSVKLNQQAGIPVVFIDSYFAGEEDEYVNVGLQDYEGAYEMTRYLMDQGHKRIGFLADEKEPVGVDRQRLEGCRAALLEQGPAVEERYIALDFREKERHEFLRRFCREKLAHGSYTALMFASDYYAMDAVNVFFQEGILVPDQISVTGFDDNVFARQCRPQLTTVHQSPFQKAKTAVELLLSLLKGEEIPRRNIRLATSLIFRGSVKNISAELN